MEITLTANFIQEGDKGFTGWIKEIPGVVAYGDSLDLAKEQLIKVLNVKLKVEKQRSAEKELSKKTDIISQEFKFAAAAL